MPKSGSTSYPNAAMEIFSVLRRSSVSLSNHFWMALALDMVPLQPNNLNLQALSGICGSISIACWIVVFSPQIIQNFRRRSADGLSLLFISVWLAGDVFNILGAVLQGVLPTMIMLAVYYTLADIVLLGQCFYYRGFTLREEPSLFTSSPDGSCLERGENGPDDGNNLEGNSTAGNQGQEATERTALLSEHSTTAQNDGGHIQNPPEGQRRRHPVDPTHLSPATPFIEPSSPNEIQPPTPTRSVSTSQAILFNAAAIAMVCVAGILGWYASPGSSKDKTPKSPEDENAALQFDTLGQVFGYLCALLYLGSRLPQLLLNYRRKSTEGVSLLFFLFTCIGNLTYVLSILAYSPVCEGAAYGKTGNCRPGEEAALYWRYILVNLSWLVGSFGTLLLDFVIFTQFFLYKENGEAR